jgi:dynein heavy chain
VNVALQEDKHLASVDGLFKVVQAYHTLLGGLDVPTATLLRAHVQDVIVVVMPALRRLNWNSLGCLDYVARCNAAFHQFQSVLFHAEKNSAAVHVFLDNVRACHLHDLRVERSGAAAATAAGPLPRMQEFITSAEQHMHGQIDGLAKQYLGLTALLKKVASVVTADEAALQQFYHHWEMEMFGALTVMVTRNLEAMLARMRAASGPLFQVDARLSAPEVVLSPSPAEMYQLLSRFFRSTLEMLKSFPRWMHGTCEPTPPFPVDGEDEPVIFSFYDDVMQNAQVAELLDQLNQCIQSMFDRADRQLQRWKRYKPLWKLDQTTSIQKFAQSAPTCEAYDEKMQFYSKIGEEADAVEDERDVLFARLNYAGLKDTIRQAALQWVQGLGVALYADAQAKGDELRARMAGWSTELAREPVDMDSLKAVLRAMQEIRESRLEFELRLRDVSERLRTLQIYRISIALEHKDRAAELAQMWAATEQQARDVDLALVATKKKFIHVTKDQVASFAAETQALLAEFSENGPVACGSQDMDRGLAKLEEFQKRLAAAQATRQELLDAQQLFNLPLVTFDSLGQMHKEIQRLNVIFELYVAQRKAREGWSATLWAHLDLAVLEEGIGQFATKARRFPPEIKQIPLSRQLEATINEFKNSLPLIQDLKNEALRPRHWKQLMAVTGKTFDMKPDTFTLANIFEMQLHNFAEKIGDITTRFLEKEGNKTKKKERKKRKKERKKKECKRGVEKRRSRQIKARPPK